MKNVRLSKFRAVLLLSALFFTFVQGGEAFAATTGEEYVEGEALVLLKYNGASGASKISAESKKISSSQLETSKLSAADIAGAEVQSYVQSVAADAGAEAVKTYNALSAAGGKIFAHFRSKTEKPE